MDKLDSLKNSGIAQSAAKPRTEERSTTIPNGSRRNPKQAVYVRKRFVIYGIKNIVTNKSYIGSASWYDKRIGTHVSKLRKNTHENKLLQNSWNKHGEHNFIFEILEEVSSQENLISREQHYIDVNYSCSNKHGYNISCVASSRLGTSMSIEARKKISEFQKGKKLSKEQIERLKKERTEAQGISIKAVNLRTQETLFFDAINEACRTLKVSPASIRKQCDGKVKNPRKFLFTYKDMV